MPSPSRTSLDAIVAAGRRLLERDGLEALTMQGVAAAVGIRPPSLYKHVHDRGELVRLIGTHVAIELAETMEAAATTGDPRTDLRAVAGALREFVHRQPAAYSLLTARMPEAWRPDAEANARASLPIVRIAAALTGEEHALDGARTLVAWANGFLAMELAGAFRLGGDVDRAWAFGVEHLLAALTPGPWNTGPDDAVAR